MLRSRLEESEALLREALALRETGLPASHWHIAETRGLLGEVLTRLGRFTEAEPLLAASRDVLEEYSDADGARARRARERLDALNRARPRSQGKE